MAEDAIKEAKAKAPRARKRLHASFPLLCPSPVFRDKDPKVYRHHVQELLRRVQHGEDTRPATTAEVLCFLSLLSFKAPPKTNHAALFERLFRDVFPDHDLGGYPTQIGRAHV